MGLELGYSLPLFRIKEKLAEELELELASADLQYNALSWIFLQVRELSWLQWHPFSVSSSPLDGKNHVAILVKVLGDWTAKLERRVSSDNEKESEIEPLVQSCSRLTVSVEGPYGHESPYHLTYENVILVAGGIGISPFLAILSNVLHRINEGTPCRTVALLDILYINPYNVSYWWYKGLLFVACMVVSVLSFGGYVIGLWHIWERKTGNNELEDTRKNGSSHQTEPKLNKKSVQEQYATTIRYGERPDFKDVFELMSDRWGNVDIGVIVCGPPTLQTSVAKECRTQNLKRRANDAIFHFNSHSFDL